MRTLFPIPSTPPQQIKKHVAVPCPVSGRLRELGSLGDTLLASGIFGHGHAIATASSQIIAPLSGQITRIEPLDYAVVIRTAKGLILRIKIGLDTQFLMGEKCQFLVREGDKVVAGQTLFVISPPYLKQQGVDTVCIVTVLNSDKATAIVANRQSHCRALDDMLLTVYV